jgi:predicted aspartyl protease
MLRGFFLGQTDTRALVRLNVSGSAQSVMLTFEIDTGASETLIIGEELAKRLGARPFDKKQWATLANGTLVRVLQAEMTIEWLGGHETVDATIWPQENTPNSSSGGKNAVAGLIGRKLLKTAHLSIDYVNRKIVLTKPVIEEGA